MAEGKSEQNTNKLVPLLRLDPGEKVNGDGKPDVEENFQLLYPLGRVFSEIGYGLEINEGNKIQFDDARRTVRVGLGLVERLQLDHDEQQYVFLHELAHLIQLLMDPDEYIRAFRTIPQKKGGESAGLEKAWFNFFNFFLDIHANSIIKAHMPIYQQGGRSEPVPKRLYSEKLFPKKSDQKRVDYSSKPLSVQFIDYLLRRAMVDDEEVVISEPVRTIIDQQVDFFGMTYPSLEEFVRDQIFNSQTSLYRLMFILEQYLMPIYERLLTEDKKNNRLEEIPAFIGKIDIDERLNKKIEDIYQGIKKSKKTAAQRYQEKQDQAFEDWAKNQGFTQEEIERAKEIRRATEKIIKDLEDLWRNFIQQSIEITNKEIDGFTTGAGVSSQGLVNQLTVLLTRPTDAKIFYRNLPQEGQPAIKPRKINLQLIVDLSGSMDEEKRKAVQEVTYAIVKSLINFRRNGELSVVNEGLEFPIDIFYQVTGFGSTVEELTETTEEEKRERKKRDTPEKDLDEKLLRTILLISKLDLGGTEDNLALGQILSMVEQNPDLVQKLKTGEEILVILEITDGETATPHQSHEIIQRLNSLTNVFCRAIQIPGLLTKEEERTDKGRESLEEKHHLSVLPPTGTFKEVWGELGRRLQRLDVLTETMVTILYDALKHYA